MEFSYNENQPMDVFIGEMDHTQKPKPNAGRLVKVLNAGTGAERVVVDVTVIRRGEFRLMDGKWQLMVWSKA